MNCNNIVELLSAYIDGEATREEVQSVESHLESCAQCKAQLEAIKAAVSVVHNLNELEVPVDVSRSLRTIAADEQDNTERATRWPVAYLRYLVVGAAVATAVLALLLSQENMKTLDKETALIEQGPIEQSIPKEQAGGLTKEKALDTEEYNDNKAAGVGKPAESYNASKAAKDGGAPDQSLGYGAGEPGAGDKASDTLALRGLPDKADENWPMVLFTEKNYDQTSAGALLADMQKKTDGLYRVKDVGEKQAEVINKLVERISAAGGRGDLMRSPVNKLINQTKRPALPVYMEKARFNEQDCWLIIIRWGFGNDESDLYKTSLYVTDPSGQNIIHYASN